MMRPRLIIPILASALLLGAGTSSPTQVIHPGDQLSIQVFGDTTLTQSVTVMQDGTISYPLVGRVHVAGETLDVATNDLRNKLQQYVRHPNLTMSITQFAQPSVLVLGDVKNPGKYQLRSDARVTDAIAAAGGLNVVNGDLPEARVSNPQGDVSRVSLQKLLHDGNTGLDSSLGEGDVVYVPGPTLIDVVVTGAVDHPGDVQVAQGDRLSMAIAKAGNSSAANADLNHIRVIRNTPDGKSASYNVNLYQALEQGDGSADLALEKGDTIYVPQARQKGQSPLLNSGILYILGRLLIP